MKIEKQINLQEIVNKLKLNEINKNTKKLTTNTKHLIDRRII